MFTTLISTADLAARLADPPVVIVDVRHDLAQPDTWGEAQYRRGPHSRRPLRAPRPRPVRAEDRAPTAAIRCRRRRPPRRRSVASASMRRRRSSPTTSSRACTRRGCGGCCAGSGHDAVAVLDGGFEKWRREGRPVTTDVPHVAAGRVRDPPGRVHRSMPPRCSRACRRARSSSSTRARRSAFAASRAARSRRRPHSRLDQPPGLAESRRRVHVQAGRRAARRFRAAARGDACRPRRALVRLGRHRVPQPARDGDRRVRRNEALSGLVERVVRGSVPARRRAAIA